MPNNLISCDDHMDLGQLPADLWTTRLPPNSATGRRMSKSAMARRFGSATARFGEPGAETAGDRQSAPRSSRSTTRSTAPASTTRVPAAPQLPNCASPTWIATECRSQIIFGPIFQISTEDPALRVACYRVYNDWLLDFCQAAPERLIGVPMLPENPDGASEELQRLAAKGGVKQVTLMIANIDPKLDDPAWEKLWTALEDTGIVLSWHITVFVA